MLGRWNLSCQSGGKQIFVDGGGRLFPLLTFSQGLVWWRVSSVCPLFRAQRRCSSARAWPHRIQGDSGLSSVC